jgi:predicted nucleic acid-binding protein
MILVDTSAWVEFFRNRKPMADKVGELIESNRAALTGPILTELLRGVRSVKERAHLTALLEGCHWLTQPEDLWAHAGELGAIARRKGKTVKTLDLLIASHALHHNAALLTLDSDFLQIKAAVPDLLLA